MLPLALVFGLMPSTAASAAGPAVVSVVTTITDTSGTPIAAVNAQTIPNGRYVVNVAYSCNVANCTGTTVTIPGPSVDPFYGTQRRELNTYVFNPPFTPAPTISGTAYTGLTVSLGTVTAGTSGSFSIEYTVLQTTLGGVAGGSFFLNGSLIQRSATITSTTSNNPATATATATWVSTVPSPSAALTAPANTATDTDVTVSWFRSTSGCVTFNGSFLDFQAASWLTCAGSYSATVQLPPNAVYVPGSGGVYDPATRSVTFAQTGPGAARGIYGQPGSFRVQFPSTDYPTTTPGCIVTEQFTGSQTVTYLDNTVKTAKAAPLNITVGNCAPFGKANMSKAMWDSNTNTFVGSVNIPTTPGVTYGGLRWQVTANNQGNVPGFATITDAALDQTNLPVTSVSASGGTGASTINYTLDNGITGTATTSFTAPAGRRIVAVTATSGSLIGPNVDPSGTLGTPFTVFFNTSLAYGATPGQRCNTASSSMSYPAYPTLSTVNVAPVTACVMLVDTSGQTALTAGAPVATVTGGGTAVVGSEVIWSANGAIGNLATGSPLRPQYVFVAPLGWTIAANGASFTSNPPAGATFDYRTVTYGGTPRQAVVVNWAAPLGQTGNVALPQLQVKTSPTLSAPAGTSNQLASFLLGDVGNSIATSYSPGRYNDTNDLDGDGLTTDAFAVANGSTSLAPTLSFGVTKEICRPNASAADGCNWIADPNIKVGVPPTASSIKYRVTVTNQGNADLTNVNMYDVLPYIGDTGTTDATAAIPRGSTVKETLANVSNVGAGITLAYSTSTNPPRPEVYSGATSGTWTTTVAGASSIRATLATLPFQGTRSFVYTASLVGGAADQTACNSVGASANLLAPIEPRPVCATTEESDLSIVADAHFPLQANRVGAIPFTVTNLGGSLVAPATASIAVPSGVGIADLSAAGWACTAPSTTGPTTIACRPVQADGTTTRELAINQPEVISLDFRPTPSAASTVCFTGTVTGIYNDPNPANDTAVSCATVAPSPPEVHVTKTDGTSNATVGQQTTYTITAANMLVGEGINGVTVADTLPAGLAYVSSSPAATVNGQTVTWNLGSLAAAGTAGDGTSSSGAPGSSKFVTVTVRVLPGTKGTVANTATMQAPDPADNAITMTDAATDTDTVLNVFTQLNPAVTPPQNTAVTTPLVEIVTALGAPLNAGTVTVLTAPQHGALTIDAATGAVAYTPTAGYSGADSYDIRVCDTSSPAQCTTAPVNVSVAANTVTAVNDTATTTVQTAVITNVRGNDTTASGQPLANPTIDSQPGNGTAAVNANGTVTYTPKAAFSGADSYTYTACDTSTPTPVCSAATVNVQVNNVFIDGPAANVNGGTTTDQNQPVTTPLAQIVTTTGASLDPATVTEVTAPRHGSIAINPLTGAVTYTPTTGYGGTDTYRVNVCDTATPQQCHSVVVGVTIPPNNVLAGDDTATTNAGQPVTTDVLGNDTSESAQPLGVPTIVTAPVHGTAVVNADRSITYTPNAGFSGADSYGYEICDTSFPVPSCDSATVAVTVHNVFVAGPAAAGNTGVVTPQNTPVTTALTDIVTTAGMPINPADVTQPTAPQHGTLAINSATGAVTYTPTDGYSGPDSYTVTACDTATPQECHNVAVAVAVGVNVVTAVNDTASMVAGQPVTADVRANDTSASGQPFGLPTITTQAAHGTAAVNADGTVTYTPKASFSGTDSYIYMVCDTSTPTPVCGAASVSVTIANVFVDGPAAQGNLGVETPHNTAVTTALADIVRTLGMPIDATTVTEVTAPAHGTIAIDPATGAATYKPVGGYAGPDTYQVNACDTATPQECHSVVVAVTILANTVSAPDQTITTRTNETAAPLDVLAVSVSASGQPFATPPTITAAPQHGTVTVNPDNTLTYTPAENYNGSDSFTYQVCDTSTPQAVCDAGVVGVTVKPVSDLAIVKTLTVPLVIAGLPITYDIATTNNGPSVATDVHTVDPIPAAIQAPVGTPDSAVAGATCETRQTRASDLATLAPEYGPYTVSSHPTVVECTYPKLAVGQTIHGTIAGKVDPKLAAGTNLVNQAFTFATAYDPTLKNNLAAVAAHSIVLPPVIAAAVGNLARTGSEISGSFIAIALGMLIAGLALVVVAVTCRRRSRAE